MNLRDVSNNANKSWKTEKMLFMETHLMMRRLMKKLISPNPLRSNRQNQLRHNKKLPQISNNRQNNNNRVAIHLSNLKASHKSHQDKKVKLHLILNKIQVAQATLLMKKLQMKRPLLKL